MKRSLHFFRNAILLVAVFLGALSARGAVPAGALEIYVSSQTGNDYRNGSSWAAALKTFEKALDLAETTKNPLTYIYLAEGVYNEPQTIQGSSVGGTYKMTRDGQKLYIIGGFPKPGAITQPHDTCTSAPRTYISEIRASKTTTQLFRMENDNQWLVMRGLTFGSTNFTGALNEGAFLTAYKTGTSISNPQKNLRLEISDCMFKYYTAARGGAFCFSGHFLNPHIVLHRIEVLKGQANAAGGGGFLGTLDNGSKNAQLDIDYVTFHDISHQGVVYSTCLIGWYNWGTLAENPNNYCKIDHVQVARATGLNLADQQPAIGLKGFDKVSVTNSVFHNCVGGYGGVFRLTGINTTEFKNNKFWNNQGGQIGGCLFVEEANNGIEQRTTRTFTSTNDDYIYNGSGSTAAVGRGGVIYAETKDDTHKLSYTFTNCNFKQNATSGYHGGAGEFSIAGNLTFKNCVACDNEAAQVGTVVDGGGGGAFFVRDVQLLTVDGCYFGSNTSRYGGGAFQILNGNFAFSNTVFENNSADNSGTFLTTCPGGAIGVAPYSSVYQSNGYGTITNCKFIGNHSNTYGGAIGFRNDNLSTNPVTIDGCEFINNTAKAGGALGSVSMGRLITVKNSKFTNNKATDGDGGVLYQGTAAGNVVFENNIMSGNTATKTGGALYFVSGSLTMRHNFVKENTALNGGAIWNDGGGTFLFESNQFMNNSAGQAGGAIYTNDYTSFTSTGDIFNGNVANADVGGAIRFQIHNDRPTKVTQGTFVGNIAKLQKGGGAIWAGQQSGLLGSTIDELSSCTFYNNQDYNASNALVTTAEGADLMLWDQAALRGSANLSNSKMQLAKATYSTWLTDNGGNTFQYNTPVTVPTDGSSSLSGAAVGNNTANFVQAACVDPKPIDEIEVTYPHATVTTSETAPKTYATYCPGDASWVKFQSTSGEGPFTFTYDIYRTVGGTITKLNSSPLQAQTSSTPIQVTSTVPKYDFANPNPDGTFPVIGTETITETVMPDNVIITNPLEKVGVTETKAGELYTIIVTSMSDTQTTYTYDCYQDYPTNHVYSQNVGAQIFYKDCSISLTDLDLDNDGIRNDVECDETNATNTAQVTRTDLVKTSWPVAYRTPAIASNLFASIVNNSAYLQSTPANISQVLTLTPTVLGVTGSNGNVVKLDISDKFGYTAGTGRVVVSVYNYQVQNDKFITTQDLSNFYTRWEITGTMHPYVLMQSTPTGAFNSGTGFGINILDNLTPLSQTSVYTDMTSSSAQSKYIVYETNTYKKVLFNVDNLDLSKQVGLSYLNYNPTDKFFEFDQSYNSGGNTLTSVTIMLPCDDDHDGIPNVEDYDSDADGCSDAIEGDQLITADQLKDGAIDSPEDKDGIPTLVNGGQGIGASQNATVKAGCSYWIGGISNEYTNVENWGGKYVPLPGEDLVFATIDNNGKAVEGNTQVGPAVRDMVIPAGSFLSQRVLVNETKAELGKIGLDGNKVANAHPATIISAGAGLTVTSATGFSTVADEDKLLLKASTGTTPAGTFVMNNTDPCSQTVYATVEYKPLGIYNPGVYTIDTEPTSPDLGKKLYSEFDWQFIGIPVESVVKNPSFSGMKVRVYSEELNSPLHYYSKWSDVSNTTTMSKFKAYEVARVLDRGDVTTTITGKLNFCEEVLPLTRKASIVTASKAATEDGKRYGLGYNIFGNSFTAGVKIKSLVFTANTANDGLEKTIYLYSTGSFKDWATNQSSTSSFVKGGYFAIPQANAGDTGFPETIAPMQGFMVKYTNPTYSETDDQLSIPYVADALSTSTEPLHAKGMTMGESDPNGFVLATLDNGHVYDMAHFYEYGQSTEAYEPGRDAEKLNFGTPSVFATTSEGTKVQVSSLASVNGMKFGVQTIKDSLYTMSLSEYRLSYQDLKMVDLVNKQVVPFTDGKLSYFFTADVTGFEEDRFLLVNTTETDFAKIMGHVTDISSVKVSLESGTATVYTLSGKKVGEFSLPLDVKTLKGRVPAGVYMVKSTDGTTTVSQKLVID